jgi:chromosome segregation ATPase
LKSKVSGQGAAVKPSWHMVAVSLQAEALTSKATINELQSKVKQLQQQLTAQQLLHEQCSADLAAAQEELSRSREDACSLTAELQALSGQMDECVPLEEHTRALGQLRAQMRSLQEQLASAEKENAASRDVLTSQQLQQSEVETRLSQANLKLDEADQRTGQLQRALHAAEAEVARARAEAAHWQRKAEHVEQELEHVQALQELWQQQVTGCKEAADQAQHVDASSRQRLVTRIQELEDQLMASSLAVASQQQQLDQHADAEWQLAAECAQLRAEVDRLSQQLHSERAHSIAAVKDVQAVSKQDGKQLARSEPAVNDNADLSKLAQLLQEHRQLAERLQATQAKLKVMRARLAQAEGQLAAKHAREGVAGESHVLPVIRPHASRSSLRR